MAHCSDIEHHLDQHPISPAELVRRDEEAYLEHLALLEATEATAANLPSENAAKAAGQHALELTGDVPVVPDDQRTVSTNGESGQVQSPTPEEWLRALADEREADRAGTYPGSSSSDSASNRSSGKKQRLNPRTGRPTIAQQNRNDAVHRRRAYKDRWGL